MCVKSEFACLVYCSAILFRKSQKNVFKNLTEMSKSLHEVGQLLKLASWSLYEAGRVWKLNCSSYTE